MLSKSTVTLAALAVAQVALAQPYCLLTAVNKFEHPADQKTLCCTEASKVKDYLKQLCPSGDESDAVDAFNTACSEAGYGSCSSSSSSLTSAVSSASETGAPYPIVKTTTYYDDECSCTKTKVHTSSLVAGSTGFATGTAPVSTGTVASATTKGAGSGPGSGSGSGSAATGSPIVPVAPSSTGSSANPSVSNFKGSATRNMGSVVSGLLGVAVFALAL